MKRICTVLALAGVMLLSIGSQCRERYEHAPCVEITDPLDGEELERGPMNLVASVEDEDGDEITYVGFDVVGRAHAVATYYGNDYYCASVNTTDFPAGRYQLICESYCSETDPTKRSTVGVDTVYFNLR